MEMVSIFPGLPGQVVPQLVAKLSRLEVPGTLVTFPTMKRSKAAICWNVAIHYRGLIGQPALLPVSLVPKFDLMAGLAITKLTSLRHDPAMLAKVSTPTGLLGVPAQRPVPVVTNSA